MSRKINMLLAGVAALAIAPAAHAQSDGAPQLEEIVVTAQKREESLQKVPVSVTAVRSEALAVMSSGGADVKFLSGHVPSLLAESSLGRTFPRFYIRGLGNTDFDVNSSQPVSLIYDGVVLESPNLKGIPAFDLDRVEVLRGPQGTLFGRNTPAGIIKFESKKPTQQLDGFARLAFGTHGLIDGEAAIGGGLSETLAGRLSVLVQHRNDWIDNDYTGEKDAYDGYNELAARGQLLWTPTDKFSALLNVHGRRYDGSAAMFRANVVKPGVDGGQLVDGFDRGHVWTDGLNDQSLDENGAVLTINYDINDTTTFTAITSYEHVKGFSRGDIDGGYGASFISWPFPAPAVTPPAGYGGATTDSMGPGFIPFPSESSGATKVDQFTQEMRVASNNGQGFNYQAGMFYFSEKLWGEDKSYDSLSAGNPENGNAHQNQRTKAWGIFGSVSYDLTDSLKGTAGIRYSDDDKHWTAERVVSPFGAPSASFVENASDGDVSWDASLSYQVNEGSSLYTRIARGFRAPSIQGRVLFGDVTSVAKSETIVSGEIGTKNQLFNNRVRFNGDIYVFEMKGQQLTAVGGGTNITQLVNAKKTKGYGAEAELEWIVTDNLSTSGSVSYNHTRLRSTGLLIAGCGGGCTITDPVLKSGLVNINGNTPPNAPAWILNWSARYSIPVGDGEIFALTDWSYRSSVHFLLYEAKEFWDKKEVQGGVRVGYSNKGSGLEIAGYVRNVTDDTSLAGVIDFNNLTGYVNEGRSWGFEVKKSF